MIILHYVSHFNVNAGTGQSLRLDLGLRHRTSQLTGLHTNLRLLAAFVPVMLLRLVTRNALFIGLLKIVHILVNIWPVVHQTVAATSVKSYVLSHAS
jgi:hypothetical protein